MAAAVRDTPKPISVSIALTYSDDDNSDDDNSNDDNSDDDDSDSDDDDIHDSDDDFHSMALTFSSLAPFEITLESKYT